MNSRQHRTMRRMLTRRFEKFVAEIEKVVDPMIRPESLKDYQEIREGMREIGKDMKHKERHRNDW